MNKINLKPEIKEIKIKRILPNPVNPRSITEDALNGLRKSLERFGYVDLLVVNKRNMQLVSGHQRLRLLQESGVKTVSCIMVDVDDTYHQAMAISLNNQRIVGTWTAELIPILNKLRESIPADYEDLKIAKLHEEITDKFDPEFAGSGKTLPDDIPPIPKKAITKKGDLWILGNHRLLCGSSTNKKDVERLMDGKKAQLFATDPPYMVDYTGKDRPKGGKDWTGVYHEIDIPDAESFYRDFYSIGLKNVDINAALYLWHADRRQELIFKILRELKILIHQRIVWVKPATVISFSVYPWRHEPCLFGWREKHKPYYRVSQKKIGSVWPVGLMRTGDPESPEYYNDTWELDWEGKMRNTGLEHPTVKPTEVFAIPMRVHTKSGDICYEPFSGSGSQIIAAERLNRRCFAMELEPIFVDVAVKRWEEFTGKKAKKG